MPEVHSQVSAELFPSGALKGDHTSLSPQCGKDSLLPGSLPSMGATFPSHNILFIRTPVILYRAHSTV